MWKGCRVINFMSWPEHGKVRADWIVTIVERDGIEGCRALHGSCKRCLTERARRIGGVAKEAPDQREHGKPNACLLSMTVEVAS